MNVGSSCQHVKPLQNNVEAKASGRHIEGVDYSSLVHLSHEEALRSILAHYPTFGLQATQVGRARELFHEILKRRREKKGQKIFLSYTSNLISCGLREAFVYLAKERLIDGVVSTAGGIEEDVIKCLGDTYMGHFNLSGTNLRKKGLNRIGNLLVPNDHYCAFEDFFMPLLKAQHALQRACRWRDHTAPSQFIEAMARALESGFPKEVYEQSLVYWCYHHHIPVFCPAFTDGSMGDMIYFYNFGKKGLVVNPVPDVLRLRALSDGPVEGQALSNEGESGCTSRVARAALVLGGGLPKHHLLSNIPMDDVVMVSTGTEGDGSTSGGVYRDDVSAGLLSKTARVVKIQGDATTVVPLILTETSD